MTKSSSIPEEGETPSPSISARLAPTCRISILTRPMFADLLKKQRRFISLAPRRVTATPDTGPSSSTTGGPGRFSVSKTLSADRAISVAIAARTSTCSRCPPFPATVRPLSSAMTAPRTPGARRLRSRRTPSRSPRRSVSSSATIGTSTRRELLRSIAGPLGWSIADPRPDRGRPLQESVSPARPRPDDEEDFDGAVQEAPQPDEHDDRGGGGRERMACGVGDQRGREKQERDRERRQEALEPLGEDEHPCAAHVLVHAAERDEGGRHDHERGEDDALQCDGNRLSNQVCQGQPSANGGAGQFKRDEPNVHFWNIREGPFPRPDAQVLHTA